MASYNNTEIEAHFELLKTTAKAAIDERGGSKEEQALLTALIVAGLSILESVVLDINNIAFYARERYERRDRDI